MISYKPLLRMLLERDMSKMDFVKLIEISPTTAAKMWKNEYVAMEIIDKICERFDCALHDVIEYIPNK